DIGEELLQKDTERIAAQKNERLPAPMTSSGAAAVVAIVTTEEDNSVTLHIANAGDCRGVLCRAGAAIDLTVDHKANNPAEKDRIEAAGGFVHNGRLDGILAISRAFGNYAHKSGGHLIAVTELHLDEFLLLHGDGALNSSLYSEQFQAEGCQIPVLSGLFSWMKKFSKFLARVDAGRLKVYANKAALDGKLELLDTKKSIGELLNNTNELYVVVPSPTAATVSDGLEHAPKKQRISGLTDQFKAFVNAQMADTCIISADGKLLPHPNKALEMIFVLKCYDDIYALLVDKIVNGVKAFGISGTPGIGKSVFFLYMLYHLVHDQSP
ncbi:unnamed protein product, partial [Aphanomyces euteiches]